MTCPSQSSRFYHPDYIRRTVQIMKFLIVETQNTTSLKCYLQSTDTIDRWKKNSRMRMRFKVASCKCVSLESTRYSQKNKVAQYYNWVVYFPLLSSLIPANLLNLNTNGEHRVSCCWAHAPQGSSLGYRWLCIPCDLHKQPPRRQYDVLCSVSSP